MNGDYLVHPAVSVENSQKDLTTSRFVVIGATSAIGSAVCHRLAARGAQLLIAGRNEARLHELAEACRAIPYRIQTPNTEQVDACLQAAVAQLGSIAGVVNCIGSLLLKPAHLTTEAEWSEVLSTNLGSAFATVRAATKAMMNTGGSLVLVSSAAARVGLANHEAIAAAKAGVIGLTLSAAATYAPRNIRVNCVAPGLVQTPLTARITGNEASLKASVAMHALGRAGAAEDVASAIVWLLDPANAWITGQVLGVDGGLGTLRAR